VNNCRDSPIQSAEGNTIPFYRKNLNISENKRMNEIEHAFIEKSEQVLIKVCPSDFPKDFI